MSISIQYKPFRIQMASCANGNYFAQSDQIKSIYDASENKKKKKKKKEKRKKKKKRKEKKPASVAQLDAPSDWRPGGRGFNPRRGRQHSFVAIDHEIFSTVNRSLQEGQLSVSGERMCTILVNRLED